MRKLIVAAAAMTIAVASPAMACRSSESETHVFLTALPREVPPNVVVLRVVPPVEQTDQENVVEVAVVESVQGDWNHETAVIDFGRFTSCSRAYLPAEGAYVVGQRSILPARLRVRQYRRDELSGNEQGE